MMVDSGAVQIKAVMPAGRCPLPAALHRCGQGKNQNKGEKPE